VLAGPGRLDGGIEGEQVGLTGNARDRFHEPIDLLGGLCKLAYLLLGGLHHALDVEEHPDGAGHLLATLSRDFVDLNAERRQLSGMRHRSPARGCATSAREEVVACSPAALAFGTARDFDHGGGHLTARGRDFLADRRQIEGGCG
jgi:hypothetical protein